MAVSVSRGPRRSATWPSGVASSMPSAPATSIPRPTCAGERPVERVRKIAQVVNQAPLPRLETRMPRQSRRSGPRGNMMLHATLNRAVTLQRTENRHRSDPRVPLLKELADPIRLRVIDRLGHAGPATVSELAEGMRVPMPQLSNHLRRLRDAGLVTVERSGRHALYALADEGLQALLPLLDRLTGRIAPEPPEPDDGDGRTCYAHLGGRLGVGVYRALLERGALRDRPDGMVELGANGEPLAALGVDPANVEGERRRFAFECFDARQHAPHLAGALGDAVADALVTKGWTQRAGDAREVRLTPAGRRGLERALGLAL